MSPGQASFMLLPEMEADSTRTENWTHCNENDSNCIFQHLFNLTTSLQRWMGAKRDGGSGKFGVLSSSSIPGPKLADPLLLRPAPPLLLQSQGKEKGEAVTLQAPVQVYFCSFT